MIKKIKEYSLTRAVTEYERVSGRAVALTINEKGYRLFTRRGYSAITPRVTLDELIKITRRLIWAEKAAARA